VQPELVADAGDVLLDGRLGDRERLGDAALGVALCHRRRIEIEGPQQRRDELANAASSSTTGTLHGTP
jgi:hypothetical protein